MLEAQSESVDLKTGGEIRARISIGRPLQSSLSGKGNKSVSLGNDSGKRREEGRQDIL